MIIKAEQLKKELDNENLIILDCSTTANKAGIKPKFQNTKIKGALYFDLKKILADKELRK